MRWWWHLGVRSNEQAVANAREATTALSRRRVERNEVELYLRSRYAERRVAPAATALDAAGAEVAR
jgi:hypothetical protein